MEPRQENPFIVGDWIKEDKDFIGRTHLIDYFLSLQRPHNWLIGSRRMGKTSLLRFLQRRFRERPDTLCLFWDVSGTGDLSDLRDSFVDGLESAADDFSRRNIHFNADELADKPLTALLRWLIRLTLKEEFRLILLIDESEALFNLFAQDLNFQIKLTKLLANAPQCHIIMASNHGLQSYDPLNHDHLLSPFLQNIGPPKYLTAWNEEEANTLTVRCTNKRDEQTTMFHWTGGLPFLVQMLCFYYNETGSLTAAEERIRQEHMLDLFFRYDMDHQIGRAHV